MTAPVITGGSITGVALSGNTLTNPVITGGSINNTTVGATTRSTGAFTTLASNGATTFTAGTASTSTTTGTAVITGGLGVSGRINAANFDGIVGANTAAAGNFTTLGATGVATFSAGTVSAPAITTTGDTNTGIFFPAADTIAFAEGGVESMRIDSAGNLGLGVTPSGWTLGKAMQLSYSAYITGQTATEAMYMGSNAYWASGWKYINNGFASQYSQEAGIHIWYNAASGTAGNAITFSERMRIDASGNVGIGTSSPYSGSGVKTLHLTGSDYSLFEQSVTTATAEYQNWRQIVRGSVGGHVYQLQLMNDANNAEQTAYEVSRTANSVAYQRWYGGTTEAMRIDSSGNLLVGTSNDYGGLSSRCIIQPSSSTGTTLFVNTWGNTGAALTFYSNISGAPNVAGSITLNGANTAYNISSDYRLKQNIAPMTGALATVSALKPVTYKWKIDGSDGQGFIAHELQEIVPDCVTGEKDAVNEDGSIKPQGVDTSFLVATLTAAIQELKATVDAQAARIAALESK
jgi:hypothetical protein